MQRSYDPLTRSVTDLQIDTSDFPLAKNFYDYTQRVLGKDISMPFARQLWIDLHLFGDICPRCSPREPYEDIMSIEVDSDPHELAYTLVLLENGVCPKCRTNKFELIKNQEVKDYNELVLVLGQRSGKSTMTAQNSAYVLHRLLKIPPLSRLCDGITAVTPLTCTFIALSAARAKRLLWNPFVATLRKSNWFAGYHKMLENEGKMLGRELLKFNALGISYEHRNLDLYPLGPLKRALRGDTRFLAATDELGLFPYNHNPDADDEDDEREFANADEVYTSLSNSLTTVRGGVYGLYKKGVYHVPTGYNFSISSPYSEKDKICRLFRESERSSFMLGVNLPTWEVNPHVPRDSPAIRSAYERDPRKAERDFGAKPPSLDASVYSEEQVLPLFHGTNNYRIVPATTSTKDLSGQLVIVNEPSILYPSVVSIDAGFTNNSFAVSVGHLKEGHLILTGLMELMPRNGEKIRFPNVYEGILKPLIEKSNAVILCADRWNSIMLGQTAENDFKKRGLKWIQYTVRSKDFSAFTTDLIDNQRLTLPALELLPDRIKATISYKKELYGKPASHLFYQFLTVQEIQGMIEKGNAATDDLLRTLVVMYAVLNGAKAKQVLEKAKPMGREGMSKRALVMSAPRTFSI